MNLICLARNRHPLHCSPWGNLCLLHRAWLPSSTRRAPVLISTPTLWSWGMQDGQLTIPRINRERQRGAHIGMELLNIMELAIPRNVGKVVDLRSYLLEPIKDRSSLATIFSVHELSHAKKTSKSIHPTLPIRNPSCGRLPPWSELILTGWPTFGVMHLAVTLRADGLMERHLDDIFAAQLALHSQAGGQANALDRLDSDCIAKSLSHQVSWLCNTWVLQMIYLDHSRSF